MLVLFTANLQLKGKPDLLKAHATTITTHPRPLWVVQAQIFKSSESQRKHFL